MVSEQAARGTNRLRLLHAPEQSRMQTENSAGLVQLAQSAGTGARQQAEQAAALPSITTGLQCAGGSCPTGLVCGHGHSTSSDWQSMHIVGVQTQHAAHPPSTALSTMLLMQVLVYDFDVHHGVPPSQWHALLPRCP